MSNKLTYLDFNDAVKKSLKLASNQIRTEFIPLGQAIGRVLSKDITCKKNLPAFNNSAMDGFAFKSSDAGKKLKVNRVIFAGDKGEKVKANLADDECYRIMTGAQVPSDVDTIVPIENCLEVSEEFVTIPNEIKKGANLRLKGEEQKEGSKLFCRGEKVNSSIVTLLASQGIVMVEVYKKLSIAIVSTGNELKEPWQDSDNEEIYNCNSYALIALLKEKGFDSDYCGVIPDNLEETISFISGLKSYDLVITTGGISLGDADFMAEAFLKNGLETAFHGVNVKPGRPIMMGKMKDTVVMCLPGNPLTAMVNLRLFAIPVLNKMQGSDFIYHKIVKASNQSSFRTKAGRVNVVLGSNINGKFTVTRNNKYGSGMITALYESNSILVTQESTSQIEENDEVILISFDDELGLNQTNIFN